MAALLLTLIYAAFISLGLPDSILGAAWPVMHKSLSVPVSYAGILTLIISLGTVVSSLNADRLTKRFGTGLLTTLSVLITAVAMGGFATAPSFIVLCLWAIPYGLGAGAVDAALNNYVALHYSSRHMQWLHCFWGVGVTLSPYIMSWSLIHYNNDWQIGYQAIAILQIVLTALLIFSLPLWKKPSSNTDAKVEYPHKSLTTILAIPHLKPILGAFFCYCALESTVGLWASTWLVEIHHQPSEKAAQWAAYFYMGIMIGRFISGFVSNRLGNKNVIKCGLAIIFLGVLNLLLPPVHSLQTFLGLLFVGLGCAPIFPAIIHETPNAFGAENSQSIIGIQMACAYVGTTLTPLTFGLIASHTTMHLYPFMILTLLTTMAILLKLGQPPAKQAA